MFYYCEKSYLRVIDYLLPVNTSGFHRNAVIPESDIYHRIRYLNVRFQDH